MFENKTILITRGTGSFGSAVLQHILDTNIRQIRIFSRDEKNRTSCAADIRTRKFAITFGDVRDYSSVKNAMCGVDYVFHAAALKQVPSCELFPLEAIKTNILGT